MARRAVRFISEHGDRVPFAQLARDMQPHEALPSGLPSVADHEEGRLIALCAACLLQEFRHVFRHLAELVPGKTDDPVGHGLPGERCPAAPEFSLLPVEREAKDEKV